MQHCIINIRNHHHHHFKLTVALTLELSLLCIDGKKHLKKNSKRILDWKFHSYRLLTQLYKMEGYQVRGDNAQIYLLFQLLPLLRQNRSRNWKGLWEEGKSQGTCAGSSGS